VRLRRWVSFHGISLNVEPDLEHFAGIIPCGVTDHGVTSLVGRGRPGSKAQAHPALKASFERVFGPTQAATPPI
jgi:lipoyl(octanoyl) transferase